MFATGSWVWASARSASSASSWPGFLPAAPSSPRSCSQPCLRPWSSRSPRPRFLCGLGNDLRLSLWRRNNEWHHVGLDHRHDSDEGGEDDAVPDHAPEDLALGADLVYARRPDREVLRADHLAHH